MFDRIRYRIVLKTYISDAHSDKYMKIRINADGNLSLEKNIKYA